MIARILTEIYFLWASSFQYCMLDLMTQVYEGIFMSTTLTREDIEYIPKKMETVSCPICGKEDYKFHEKIGYKHKFQYVKCKNCTNVFLNPRPAYDQDYLDTAYSVYGMDSLHVKHEGQLSNQEEESVRRYEIVVKYLEDNYNKKGKILDLGCGTGLFLLSAKRRGWDTYGIDISEPMTTFARESFGIPTQAGQFQDLDLTEWGKFDVIYCSHVIEHIPNPNEWMQVFRKHLKDDGVLVLNVPNQYAPEKVIQRFLKSIKIRKDEWARWRTPDHLYEPHLKSMQYLFNNSDFKLQEYFTYSSREKENDSVVNEIFHKTLKCGSKLRFFLKPRT